MHCHVRPVIIHIRQQSTQVPKHLDPFELDAASSEDNFIHPAEILKHMPLAFGISPLSNIRQSIGDPC